MSKEFEITAYMDDSCSLRQLSQLITDIETETGLDCGYDGNLSYSCDGEIHIYQCSLTDTVQILKLLVKWQDFVTLYSIIDGTKEWYTSEGVSLMDVMRDGLDKIADRLLKAMGY